MKVAKQQRAQLGVRRVEVRTLKRTRADGYGQKLLHNTLNLKRDHRRTGKSDPSGEAALR
jgi:hypothetical protein